MQGIYRSTDGGATFGVISPEASDLFNPPGDQGNYNLCIAVNPADENRIYVGGQIDSWTWKSSTGAWTPMSNSGYPEYFAKYIHADHHTIVFHPTNPDIMYFEQMVVSAELPMPGLIIQTLAHEQRIFYLSGTWRFHRIQR